MSAPSTFPAPAPPSVLEQERRLKSTFRTQAKALFRKNATQQRRALWQNFFIIITPIFFVVLLYVLQRLINNAIQDDPNNKCGCLCLRCCDPSSSANGSGPVCRDATPDAPCNPWEDCEQTDDARCGIEYSNADQASVCSIPSPSIWPPLFQVPPPDALARPQSPDAAILITGDGESIVTDMQLFPEPNVTDESIAVAASFTELGQATNAVYAGFPLLGVQMGTSQKSDQLFGFQIEFGFLPNPPEYNGTLSLMTPDPTSQATQQALDATSTAISLASYSPEAGESLSVEPLGTVQVWQANASAMEETLYCGYRQAFCYGSTQTNAYTNAYDFSGTEPANDSFAMTLYYNSTDRYPGGGNAPTTVIRINAAINAATNAFLRWAFANPAAAQATAASLATLVGVMEMPKPETKLTLDIASLIGTLFYTWLLQLLLPVMLSALVAEKEGRLRTIMKMHGLGDGAYWAIQYVWYFALNMVYVWVLIGAGSAIGLSFFTRTDYSFQFVFYLLWVTCLVAFTFLLSSIFRSTRTAVVTAFLYVFGTGLVGYLLMESLVAAGREWVIALEIIPGFGLYRGLYEIAQYGFRAAYQGTQGMTWSKLGDDNNGLPAVMIIFAIEAVVFLLAAWYIEQVFPGGVGVPRHPLFFLGKRYETSHAAALLPAGQGEKKVARVGVEQRVNAADVAVAVEPADVAAERERVASIADDRQQADNAQGYDAQGEEVILMENLCKVFPGGKVKIAVRDLSLGVSRGECFGLLGPNGAGKSTTLNVLTGFLTPTSGTATVQGHDIRSEMDKIYGVMGVCPQDNLLWPRLTAREHLLFYGRLKNLKGDGLHAAVQSGLRSVNLWNGGVADKEVRTFSGGMKRRLQVAISLIGNPLVVYLDEPSTGLDPASRQNLWSVIKQAKRDRGIILTTHSMEEAAVLCDRLGIFVDGQLVCIGAPKELTQRHGGYLVLTVTSPPGEEEEKVDVVVKKLSPAAKLTYALAGTRRYELPVQEVSLASVFDVIGGASARGEAQLVDWGVSNATLEEVFIAFAKERGVEGGN